MYQIIKYLFILIISITVLRCYPKAKIENNTLLINDQNQIEQNDLEQNNEDKEVEIQLSEEINNILEEYDSTYDNELDTSYIDDEYNESEEMNYEDEDEKLDEDYPPLDPEFEENEDSQDNNEIE
jgi:hypothetical protein